MKKTSVILGLAGVAFGVTLAALIGARLSEQALAVVAGATCGAGALLPVIAVQTGLLLRQRSPDHDERQARSNAACPPLVVIAPPTPGLPAGQSWGSGPPYGYPVGFAQASANHSVSASARQFSIIGSDGEEMTYDGHQSTW